MVKFYVLLLIISIANISNAQWQEITNPQLGNITNIKFISSTNGWLINLSNTPPQGLLRTTDGGNTWAKILDHPVGLFHWLLDFDFYDDSLGYALGISDYFRTSNGGRTWSRQSGGASNPSSRIFSPYLAFSGGTYLYRSRDSLSTWSFVSQVPVATFESDIPFLNYISPDTIIASGGSPSSLGENWTGTIELYRSIDSGFTWSRTYLDTMISCQATTFLSWFSGKWTLWGSVHSKRICLSVKYAIVAWKAAPMAPRATRTS